MRQAATISGSSDSCKPILPDKRNHNIIFTYKPKDDAEEAIYHKLTDICISMKSGDYLNIPQRLDNIVPVQLSPKVMEKYRQLERDLLLPLLNGDVVAGSAAVLANKLLQMTGGAVYDEDGAVQEIHNEKLNALGDLIEAANGKPVLVYYAYRHEVERIRKRFDCRVLDKPKDIEDWNKGQVPMMLAHPASAGHGLNLQGGGSTIIWFGTTNTLPPSRLSGANGSQVLPQTHA